MQDASSVETRHPMKTITVEVQPDHLQTLAKVKRPLVAVTELMWNGLDADASQIDVVLRRTKWMALQR